MTVEQPVELTPEERRRQVLVETGFGFIPKDAFDMTLLEMDSGRVELGWRIKDKNGQTITHQSAVEQSVMSKGGGNWVILNSDQKVERLFEGGIPKLRIHGRISI